MINYYVGLHSFYSFHPTLLNQSLSAILTVIMGDNLQQLISTQATRIFWHSSKEMFACFEGFCSWLMTVFVN